VSTPTEVASREGTATAGFVTCERGEALLVVPVTYDYPELSALALLEAARALSENKQAGQAVKLLRRVMADHAGTAHAEAAKKRLTDLGEES